MDINDKKVITELKVIRDTLKDIKTDDINFDAHVKIIRCETSLDVIINLIDNLVL